MQDAETKDSNPDTESVDKKKARIAEAKSKLNELLANGKIDAVEYNRRVVELEVPPEQKNRNLRAVKKGRFRLLGLIILGLAVLAIPAAIYLNWRFYFQNNLTTAGAPDYSEMFQSSLMSDPIQINLDGYSTTGMYKGRPIAMTYKAYYDITGVVTSVRDYFGFGAYDTLVPRDVCLIWGDLAAQYPSSQMSFHNGKRTCESKIDPSLISAADVKYRQGTLGSVHMGVSLVSNNHLIPSTPEVRGAIFALGIGDIVRIHGYLVRAEYDGITLDSSMSRDDVIYDHTSTTCEIIYVTGVEKLGHK